MKFLVGLFLFFSLQWATAQEVNWFKSDSKGDHYLVASPGENSWVLEHFLVPQRQLQNKLQTTYHKDFQALKSAVELNFKGFRLISDFSPKAVTLYSTTEVASSSLWKVVNRWDSDWEDKYSKWVKDNFDKEFFVRYNLATDCADVAYALRWIFSRENQLPAANRLSGSGVLFSQDSIKSSWQKLPQHKEWFKDKKFLAALKYLLYNTYTHTLERDTYPVSITREALSEGAIVLSLFQQSGHTMMISKANFESSQEIPITLLSSTVPSTVRSLIEQPMIHLQKLAPKEMAFKRMRWPLKSSKGWSLKSTESHPLFSLEQFEGDYADTSKSIAMTIYKKLAPNFIPESIVTLGLASLVDDFSMREEVINEGYEFCQKNSCKPGTENWENWSTPSRDKRIKEKYVSLEKITYQLAGINEDILKIWQDGLEKSILQLNLIPMSLKKLVVIWKNELYSSDPQLSKERRWAQGPEALALNLKDQLQALAAARTEQLAKNTCAKKCKLGDKNWEESQTYDGDKTIMQLLSADLHLREEFSDPELALHNSVLSQHSIQANNTTYSALEWLKVIPWLNSDPRLSDVDRWGDQRLKTKHRIFKKAKALYISQNNFAVLDHQSLLDLTSGQKVDFKNTGHIIYSEHSPYILNLSLINNGTQIEVFDTDSGQRSEIFEPNLKLEAPVFHHFNLLSFKLSDTELLFLNIQETAGQLKVHRQLEAGYFASKNEDDNSLKKLSEFYRLDSAKKITLSLFDANDGQYSLHEIKNWNLADRQIIGLNKINQENYLITTFDYQDKLQNLVYSVSSQSVVKKFSTGFMVASELYNGSFLVNLGTNQTQGSSQLIEFDHQFNIRPILNFNGMAMASQHQGTDYIVTYQEDLGMKIYRLKGSKIDVYKNQHSGVMFSNLKGDVVISYIRSQEGTLKTIFNNFDNTKSMSEPTSALVDLISSQGSVEHFSILSGSDRWFSVAPKGTDRSLCFLNENFELELPLLTAYAESTEARISAVPPNDSRGEFNVRSGSLVNFNGDYYIWLMH